MLTNIFSPKQTLTGRKCKEEFGLTACVVKICSTMAMEITAVVRDIEPSSSKSAMEPPFLGSGQLIILGSLRLVF
jgi:hypothetical protein